MKCCVITIIFFCGLLMGQQSVFVNHINNSKQMINPACMGFESTINTSFFSKQAWNGPYKIQTNIICLESSVSQKRLALGIYAFNEQLPIQSNSKLTASIGYKLNAFKGFLCFGLSAGLIISKINLSNLTIKDIDDEYAQNLHNSSNINFDFGVSYKRKTMEFGLSVRQLNKPNLYYNSSYLTNKLNRNLNLVIVKKHIIKNDTKLEHAIIATFLNKHSYNLCYMPKLKFKDNFAFSLGYKSFHSILLGLDLNLKYVNSKFENVHFGYIYENGLQVLTANANQVHEFMINIVFDKPERLAKIKNKPKEITPLDF